RALARRARLPGGSPPLPPHPRLAHQPDDARAQRARPERAARAGGRAARLAVPDAAAAHLGLGACVGLSVPAAVPAETPGAVVRAAHPGAYPGGPGDRPAPRRTRAPDGEAGA